MKKLFIFFIFLSLFGSVDAAQGLVVCLHGFFRSYKCLIPLGHSLQNEGIDVYLWDYRSRSKTIEQHAEDLVIALNALAQAYPGEPIHFVTHSLGGIIVRAAVNHPYCPEEAKSGKAILLAPPNQGAALARRFKGNPVVKLVFGKNAGQQLLNYEAEDMQKFGKFPPSMEVMVVAGDKNSKFTHRWINKPNDGKVTIEETCLDTPHYHIVDHVSHTWIMTSRKTISWAKAYFLSQEERLNP